MPEETNDRYFKRLAPEKLDPRQLRRQFSRAAATFDAAAVHPRTVADRLLERLDVVRLQPASILDAGCGTGYLTRALGRRYRRAHIVGIDLAPTMAQTARANAGWFPRSRYVGGDAALLPFADASFDMVASNLMLQWCEPARVFPELLRVMRPGSLLVFTSFGPDTLKELREAWAGVDRNPHVHPFLDMHDVGDALLRAGFADPVMDVERYTLTYADVDTALRELKALGAQNALRGRALGLTGRARFARFREGYLSLGQEGRVPVTYEVVHGHAWVAEPRSSRQRGSTAAIPIESIRRRRP